MSIAKEARCRQQEGKEATTGWPAPRSEYCSSSGRPWRRGARCREADGHA